MAQALFVPDFVPAGQRVELQSKLHFRVSQLLRGRSVGLAIGKQGHLKTAEESVLTPKASR